MSEAAITPAPTGTPEAAQQTAAAPAAETRPDFLLPKYKTVEEQARGYAELEKKYGNPANRFNPNAPQIPAQPVTPDLPDDAGISAIVERAGLKEADITKEWQTVKYRAPTKAELERGDAKAGDQIPYNDLTAEQYAAFKKQGIPKGAVKEYMQIGAGYSQQIVEKAMTDAYAVAGSKEQHENLLQWAGNGGITAEERDTMNAELAADPRKIVAITERLQSKHTRAVGAGNAQPLINGGTGAQPMGAYKSSAEITKVILSPEYRNDPSVRERHQKRLALTDMHTIQTYS